MSRVATLVGSLAVAGLLCTPSPVSPESPMAGGATDQLEPVATRMG